MVDVSAPRPRWPVWREERDSTPTLRRGVSPAGETECFRSSGPPRRSSHSRDEAHRRVQRMARVIGPRAGPPAPWRAAAALGVVLHPFVSLHSFSGVAIGGAEERWPRG